MKPSWDDAPEWAKFVAMDFDGEWYWHETRPTYCKGEWHSDGIVVNCGFSIDPRLTISERQ